MNRLTISMVKCATDTETRDISIEKVLEAIRTGGNKLKGQIQQIRNRFEAELAITGDRKKARQAVDALKKQLPGVTPSGRFKKRANDALIEHSGLQCADIDSLGERLPLVRKKLETSPHVLALFLSPTGDGLKAWFRVSPDAAKHLASFRAIQKHVRELAGEQIDESRKDLSGLCFMSYDPEIYVNDNAVAIEPLPESEKPKASPNGAVNLSERQRIATELLGHIEWQNETSGYVVCPGKHLHTTGDGERDCRIDFDHVPTVHCFHDHCRGILDAINRELRSRIGKAEFANTKPVGEGKNEQLSYPSRNAEAARELQKDIAAAHDSSGSPEDDETLSRLAAMPPLEYERIREAEAERLGCRASVLDSLVKAKRSSKPGNDTLQGHAVTLAEVEPWPETVNGAEILDQVSKRFENYVVLPQDAADLLALWCAHTYVFKLFQKSPRLYISAPTEECGKTTLRNCTSLFCARAVRTDNMTTAVMFRLVSGHSPTILTDECDKWLFTNEELVGLVQSGHEKGVAVWRCEGDPIDLREFGCYAPFAMAAIGKLPSQLHSRSICIRLTRARKEEIKKRLRFDLEHVEYETELNRKLARWTSDNRERIRLCDPRLPEHLFNRISDNWRPLFAIAEAAGGDWPQRCLDALVKLTTREDERDNLRVMLLADIQQVFTSERIFSRDLVERLAELKERPWPEICRGKPITARWLASNLAAFRIHSRNIWDGEKQEQAKGYERAQFDDAFARYIPETQEGGNLSVQPSNSEVKPKNLSVQREIVWTDKKEPIHEAYGRLDACETPTLGKGVYDTPKEAPNLPENEPATPPDATPIASRPSELTKPTKPTSSTSIADQEDLEGETLL